MDGPEYDVTAPLSQRLYYQDLLHGAEYHAQETGDHLLASRLKQAQAGDKKAQAFFMAALRQQDSMLLVFLKKQAGCGNRAACELLRGHYLALLLDIRAGNKRAGVTLRKQVLARDQIACTLLTELINRGDQVALNILYGGWLKLCWQGDKSALAFFQRELQGQQEGMLAFLSERAICDKRIGSTLLFPYYRSLLSRAAAGNKQEMGIFQKQLQREDEAIQVFLVQQIEQKNDDAFRVIWEYYRPRIYRYIKAIVGNVEKAEDLTTNVFLKASRSLPTRRDKNRAMNLRQWLYTVAHNITIDSWREKEIETFPLSMDVDVLVGGIQPGPEDEICDREISKPLLEALQRLSKQIRTCILMADVGGYSTQEIATTLGIKQHTVTSHLSRGRAKLVDYYLQASSGQRDEGWRRLFGGRSASKRKREDNSEKGGEHYV